MSIGTSTAATGTWRKKMGFFQKVEIEKTEVYWKIFGLLDNSVIRIPKIPTEQRRGDCREDFREEFREREKKKQEQRKISALQMEKAGYREENSHILAVGASKQNLTLAACVDGPGSRGLVREHREAMKELMHHVHREGTSQTHLMNSQPAPQYTDLVEEATRALRKNEETLGMASDQQLGERYERVVAQAVAQNAVLTDVISKSLLQHCNQLIAATERQLVAQNVMPQNVVQQNVVPQNVVQQNVVPQPLGMPVVAQNVVPQAQMVYLVPQCAFLHSPVYAQGMAHGQGMAAIPVHQGSSTIGLAQNVPSVVPMPQVIPNSCVEGPSPAPLAPPPLLVKARTPSPPGTSPNSVSTQYTFFGSSEVGPSATAPAGTAAELGPTEVPQEVRTKPAAVFEIVKY